VLAVHGSTLLELRLAGSVLESNTGPRGDRDLKDLCSALAACDQLRVLDLGDLALHQALRRPILSLLQRCAPTLRVLKGVLPPAILQSGLSSLFSTGTCLEGGARQLVELGVLLEGRPTAAFADVLRANTGTLRRVRLHAPLGDAVGAVLVRALHEAPLEELALAACGLGPNAIRYLEGAAASRGSRSCGGAASSWRLECLVLSGNRLGDEVLPLLEALRGQRQLRELQLRACSLTSAAGGPLGRLAMALPALLVLDLRDNGGFGAAGVRSLVEAALREGGQQGLGEGAAEPTSLPGRMDLRESGLGPGEEAAPEAPEPPLPRRVGRFDLCWEEGA